MPQGDFTIRECVSIEDFQQCIELERAVWKDEDIDIMPIRLYMISKACQAPTFGAFDEEGRLVGFVHTMLALMGGTVVYHSHMAAVVEGLRHRDIGFRLKLAQRDRAISSGIPLIVWTFDPLQSRNAHFNVNKLGAIVRRYEENYYGEGVSTVFDAGVPSDRIFAEWWVASPHVESVLSGGSPRVTDGGPAVTLPDDISAVRDRSLDEHRAWRMRVRAEFARSLGSGLIVRAFAWDREKRGSRYLFGPDEDQFHFKPRADVRA
jgi:predicted GNAT superfamily acetyltransferase